MMSNSENIQKKIKKHLLSISSVTSVLIYQSPCYNNLQNVRFHPVSYVGADGLWHREHQVQGDGQGHLVASHVFGGLQP